MAHLGATNEAGAVTVKTVNGQAEKLEESTLPGEAAIMLRRPVSEDGILVHQLVGHCPPLDENSLYCNLLQASHFAETSVAAEQAGRPGEAVQGTAQPELAGFVSGYLLPDRPDTLFIWQVAVSEKARGLGLAGRMLREILQRPGCGDVRYLETTITPGNRASWALFRGLARKLNARCNESLLFSRDRHFWGRHDDEILLRIGPFWAPAAVC